MKQGTANNTHSATKQEPDSRGVNPGYAVQLGTHVGTARAVEPMYEGRGLKAPMVSETCHPSGSQGKHK